MVSDVFGEFFQTSILNHSKHSGYDFVTTQRNTITSMTTGEFDIFLRLPTNPQQSQQPPHAMDGMLRMLRLLTAPHKKRTLTSDL
jgi:hypothetical protein